LQPFLVGIDGLCRRQQVSSGLGPCECLFLP
jgi:hypothetical protein